MPAGVQAPAGDALTLGLRPHALHIERADTAAPPQGIVLPGAVEASEFLGKFTRCSVRVGSHVLHDYHPHQTGGAAAVGTRVRLGLAAAQVRLFAG